MLNEYAHLGEGDKRAFIPMHISKITREQKRRLLRILVLIKKNRCGKIKGRMVVDGRKQLSYIENYRVSSPAVHLEILLITMVVDAYKSRDTVILDVGRAFLLSKIVEFVLIKLDGNDLEAMIYANPSYKDYVMTENGKKVLYLRLRTAMHGII